MHFMAVSAKYLIDLHHMHQHLISTFVHIHISICTKLHIFAQIEPLNKTELFFPLNVITKLNYVSQQNEI